MIEQILDFTRARLGPGIPLDRHPLDLADVSRRVVDELQDETGAEQRVRLEIAGDVVGTWDGDRLSQLVSNLVGNALQHGTPSTPVALCIDGSQAETVTLEVKNEGLVPKALLPLMFEPFRGGGEGRPRASSGLGLGLFIARQIVLAHGGTLAL